MKDVMASEPSVLIPFQRLGVEANRSAGVQAQTLKGQKASMPDTKDPQCWGFGFRV